MYLLSLLSFDSHVPSSLCEEETTDGVDEKTTDSVNELTAIPKSKTGALKNH